MQWWSLSRHRKGYSHIFAIVLDDLMPARLLVSDCSLCYFVNNTKFEIKHKAWMRTVLQGMSRELVSYASQVEQPQLCKVFLM